MLDFRGFAGKHRLCLGIGFGKDNVGARIDPSDRIAQQGDFRIEALQCALDQAPSMHQFRDGAIPLGFAVGIHAAPGSQFVRHLAQEQPCLDGRVPSQLHRCIIGSFGAQMLEIAVDRFTVWPEQKPACNRFLEVFQGTFEELACLLRALDIFFFNLLQLANGNFQPGLAVLDEAYRIVEAATGAVVQVGKKRVANTAFAQSSASVA